MQNKSNGDRKGKSSSFTESKIDNPEVSAFNQINIANKKAKNALVQWFYDLSISRKHLTALIACELVSILGLGIGGTLIITRSLHNQLIEQAKSEVAVTDVNYNIKINQMGFGFRGQSDNPAIIQAAILYNDKRYLNSGLKANVKQILVNEIKARKIEYATLVGKDLKIIVNANSERQGEVFNPDNLVSEVLANSKQIKASRIVSRSELKKENAPLPTDFINQDELIRYTITPVRDPKTQTVVGVLVSGDIVNGKNSIVKGILQATKGGYSAIYLRKPTGEFVLVTSLAQNPSETIDQAQANLELPQEGLSLLKAATNNPEGVATGRIKVDNQTYTVATQAIPDKIVEEINGSRIIFGKQPSAILVRGTPENNLNNLLAESLSAQTLSVLVALLLIAIWALILRRCIILPIENLQHTAQKFATGDRTIRTSVFATDEIGKLAFRFNSMADSIVEQVRYQENEAKLARQINHITAQIRESLNHDKILKALVSTTRDAIQTDRVLFCHLNDGWEQGTVLAESVNDSCLAVTIQEKIAQPYSTEEYEIGSVKVVENVYEAALSRNSLLELERFAVKAYLISPIFINKKLYGLLVAHQCSSYRHWQNIEISLFKQVAVQVGYALEQAELIKQLEQKHQTAITASIDERQQKENLQMQILKLLDQVEGAAAGNLTVRAEVTLGEIGTVADFFNSTVESLRDIVTKVKASAIQVNNAIGVNSEAIRLLAEEAKTQAAETNFILDAVDEMNHSIQEVALSAKLAAGIANSAADGVNKSSQAMDLTVQSILHLREAVGETAYKVKSLGESTGQISYVVSLINQIALQTNLLAINAGLEAQRVGEGQGFALVAQEVSELAARCAIATQDIEQIVDKIQRETSEVLVAMEIGTAQIAQGTQIVEDAKYSVSQIFEVSRQIDSLVQSISISTASQVQTSQTVSTLMKKIAALSQRTSVSSVQVSQSLQQTLEISHQLQKTVATFQVN